MTPKVTPEKFDLRGALISSFVDFR